MGKIWELTQEDLGVAKALGTLIRLKEGILRLDDMSVAEPPVWGNFVFFSKWEAGPVLGLSEEEKPTGHATTWEVTQWVEFYMRGERVATVNLVGCDIEGFGAFWSIANIQYRDFPVGCSALDEPGKWREIRFDPQGPSLVRI